MRVRVLNAAEIITLRAIALKRFAHIGNFPLMTSRDHNATSYSTETLQVNEHHHMSTSKAEIITLRAIALKRFTHISNFPLVAMQRS